MQTKSVSIITIVIRGQTTPPFKPRRQERLCIKLPIHPYSVCTDLRSPLVLVAPPTDLSKMTKSTRYMLQKIRGVFFLRSPKRRRQPPPVAQLGGGTPKPDILTKFRRNYDEN